MYFFISFVHLYIYLFICLFIYLYIYLFICLFIYLFIYLFILIFFFQETNCNGTSCNHCYDYGWASFGTLIPTPYLMVS